MYVLVRRRVMWISPRQCPKSGFTFIEMAVSLALLFAAIAPITYVFTHGLNVSREMEVNTQCLILAQDLIEETLSKNFEETSGSFGRESGESTANRANYDDVDDYDRWGPNNAPEYIDGTQMDGSGSAPDYTFLRRSVVVQNVSNADFDTDAADGSTDFKKIQVTVNTIPNYIVSVTRTLEIVVSNH